MSEISTIGLDLAKRVFQIHGVDGAGVVTIRRQLRRAEMVAFFAKLSPCVVGMEACASAHHWGRTLAKLGHEVRLIAPARVKPYVKRGRNNDAVDAAAIAEAVTRPHMEFAPVKSEEAQAVLMLHRTRRLLVTQRTMPANALRSHFAEYGVVEPEGQAGLTRLRVTALDAPDTSLPQAAREAIFRRLGQQNGPHRLGDHGQGRHLHPTGAAGRLNNNTHHQPVARAMKV